MPLQAKEAQDVLNREYDLPLVDRAPVGHVHPLKVRLMYYEQTM